MCGETWLLLEDCLLVLLVDMLFGGIEWYVFLRLRSKQGML